MRNELFNILKRRRLSALLIRLPADIRAFLGLDCDNGCLAVAVAGAAFYTDFRYIPAARRLCPGLKVRDIKRLPDLPLRGRVGFEAGITHAAFLSLEKSYRRATFVDVSRDLAEIRAVKTPDEIAKLRAAEALDCEIFNAAAARFVSGMTEREMAAAIKTMMIERGEGEAFETIVCVGRNAAECHHVPDDTVWDGKESVLVDMGVRLNGYCSDLTRNLLPKRMSRAYRQAYALVREANRAAIAAAKPGMSGKALDKIARDVIRKGGFGKCFGHSLGHGVGVEIHEAPNASKSSDWLLKPGMLVTVEPGIYLEGNLGIRYEDLVLITETGCEVLSTQAEDCAWKS